MGRVKSSKNNQQNRGPKNFKNEPSTNGTSPCPVHRVILCLNFFLPTPLYFITTLPHPKTSINSMKSSSNFLLTLTATIFSTAAMSQAVVIAFEDFEDLTVNFTASNGLFHDGSSDYFHITPLAGAAAPSTGAFTGHNGNHHFAAEDIDDGGTRPSQQTLTFTIGITGFENITVSTLFAAGGNDATPGYDANDGYLMRASIDGNPFQNLLAFEATGTTNQPLAQDTDFNGTGDGSAIDHNFLTYGGLAVTGTGNVLTLEIIIDSNDGSGEFAFDDVIVEGDSTIPEPSTGLLALAGAALLFRRRK